MLALSAAGPAAAFPDGAPWEAAEQQGCAQCHFDAPVVEESEAVEIEGLPERVAPAARYRLTVRLTSERMGRAGFLLSAWQTRGDAADRAADDAAGRFSTHDERAVAQGARARSTEAGAAPSGRAVAEWKLEWIAPEQPRGSIRFELWANAANDDESPFGDQTHRRSWRVPAE